MMGDDPLEVTVNNGEPADASPSPAAILKAYRTWLVREIARAKEEYIKDKERGVKTFIKMWEERHDRFKEALEKLDKLSRGIDD